MKTKTDPYRPETVHLAGLMKALGHPARLEILRVLAARTSCVCGEIVEELPLAQATVSQHLKVLKEAGLIDGEIDGPRVCYCLDREALDRFSEQIPAFLDSLNTSTTCC
ncbi:MAG: metalloregulator ArsR/SmtB family transcription factor [Rhodothermales bacterium]